VIKTGHDFESSSSLPILDCTGSASAEVRSAYYEAGTAAADQMNINQYSMIKMPLGMTKLPLDEFYQRPIPRHIRRSDR